ncbi:MAG: hypothetical protein EU530_09335 [Promethearchaeota archaeon]|nr:MAG: hypothetical protein EU530_09335 [Candidatus Lokiarchaeota archaeon]
MSRAKTRSKRRKNKAKNWKVVRKPTQESYTYLFHVSTQPRKILQPNRTSFCYKPDEDRVQALLFLCPRHEIKDWVDWVAGKRRDRHDYKFLLKGGYITLYIHAVRVFVPDLIIPSPRYGNEFVVKDRLRPRAIIPMRFSYNKKIDLSKVNSTLKRLNELKVNA